MTEFTMDRLRENLEALKMRNTLEILDNYLERAVAAGWIPCQPQVPMGRAVCAPKA